MMNETIDPLSARVRKLSRANRVLRRFPEVGR